MVRTSTWLGECGLLLIDRTLSKRLETLVSVHFRDTAGQSFEVLFQEVLGWLIVDCLSDLSWYVGWRWTRDLLALAGQKIKLAERKRD
jgi:hypothetical protein